MDIDFSEFDNLFKSNLSTFKNKKGSNTPEEQLNANKSQITAIVDDIEPQRYTRLEKDKEAQEKVKEVFKNYQENILKSTILRSEILKDIKLGQDPYYLSLKAIECISLMVGDPSYYNQAKEDLQAIHGALGHKAPTRQEVEEIEERLKRLTTAFKKENDKDNRLRLQLAIKIHEERKEELLKQLEQ